MAKIELPYFATEITTPSSPFALSLARYLHSIGAKMYGAFWCSHCLEQKEVCDYLQFILKSLALLSGTIIIMIYDYVFYLFLIELP